MSIKNLIDEILEGDGVTARKTFDNLINERIADEITEKKDNFFNKKEDEDDDKKKDKDKKDEDGDDDNEDDD
ncbi:MAG: prohead core protein [Hyphomicrobiales bacterium]|nr:MAG: prohead core protein [Hyphomicrobiales bacterium]